MTSSHSSHDRSSARAVTSGEVANPASDGARAPAVTASADAANDAFDRALAQAAVLVVDDEPGICNFLRRALQPRCALVEVAGSAEEAEALRLRYRFDVLVVDIRLPALSGLDWVSRLRERGIGTPVIYMTAYADLDMSIRALRHGAHDFVLKPFRTDAMLGALRKALVREAPAHGDTLARLRRERVAAEHGMVGQGPAIAATLELAQRVAPTPTTVLIEGETGSGKELVARTVHALARRPGDFVALNCGSVPAELFESELFGHVRGAFSGAQSTREGLIVHADRGTLFLDEIGELPPAMQAKLLRVLEERRVRPVGAERERRVDVRVIAATHRDLSAMVAEGRFREDLFFRLNVLPIRVPPLRERLEDLPELVEHFTESLARELGVQPLALMHTDLERLHAWHWPGNVRELRNTIERALLMGRLPADACRGAASGGAADPRAAQRAQSRDSTRGSTRGSTGEGGHGYPVDWPLEAVERAHMLAVLASTGNNNTAAAQRLGVSRKTLERKRALWRQDAAAGPDGPSDSGSGNS